MQNHEQCSDPDLLFEILAPIIDKFPKLHPDGHQKCPNPAPVATFFAIFQFIVQKSQIVNLDVSIVHDSAYNDTLCSTLHSKSSPSQTPDPPPGGHGGVKVISRSKSRSSYLNLQHFKIFYGSLVTLIYKGFLEITCINWFYLGPK